MGRWEPGLVSVVIPAYNAGRWIGAALDSIGRQTYASVEVIVVDNASTDDTAAAARAAMPTARVLHAATRGPSAAKNAGLAAARGEFVQFLDADDALEPGKIARHVAHARATGADVVWGGYVRTPRRPDPLERVIAVVPKLDDSDLLRSFIESEGFLPLAAALFRTETASAVRFDEARLVVEDVQWLIALRDGGASFSNADVEAGLRVWEHPTPTRASFIGDVPFYHSCALNAQAVAACWRARGERLDARRVDALMSVWLGAAEVLASASDARVRDVLGFMQAVDPDFRSRIRFPHRPLARALGFERAVRSVNRLRRVRDALVGRTAEPRGA